MEAVRVYLTGVKSQRLKQSVDGALHVSSGLLRAQSSLSATVY